MMVLEIHLNLKYVLSVCMYSSKATIEVVHGLMGQVIKDQLFNSAST